MRCMFVVFLTMFLCACVVHRLEVTPVAVTDATPIQVESPVKAHLNDGSTVVFANGVTVANNTVRGNGERYDLTLENSTAVTEVPLADIAAMESYQTPVSTGATTVASAGSTVAITAGVMLALFAIFGSCPTIYSHESGEPLLEAELFSYSIAPAFQMRDIDRLGIRSLTGGFFDLEVRNEMLETHYIDHLEVLEVVHAPQHKAYPDEKGRPLVAGSLIPPSAAVDQYGTDILAEVIEADDTAWSATDERLAAASGDDHLDHLDFEFAVPPGVDDVALVLRLRNSLLNTVLLYDVMLKGQSFGALDWMNRDLNRLGHKIDTGLWYRKNMGLNISVWNNGRYRKVRRIGDQGPIAWSERAVVLPAGKDGKLKVRLSFLADNWRIDKVAVALQSSRGEARVVAVDTAKTSDGDRPDIPGFLSRADKEYLITRPGDSVTLRFNVGEAPPGASRSFFIASEGYYMEWMRSDWLTEEHRQRFRPGTEPLLRALQLYADKRNGLREEFEATKVEMR